MTDGEEWLNAGAALIAYEVSDPKPLADLLRNRKEIPEATLHLLADLLDPPSVAPLGIRLRIVETDELRPNHINVSATRQKLAPNAIAHENTAHEPWQGATLESAKVACKTTIQLTKKYAKFLIKWVNHDI
jgi:hypothetical protein